MRCQNYEWYYGQCINEGKQILATDCNGESRLLVMCAECEEAVFNPGDMHCQAHYDGCRCGSCICEDKPARGVIKFDDEDNTFTQEFYCEKHFEKYSK